MTVLAHIDKLKDFLEYWNTLHISLENAVAQCPDWVQDTHNALNKALEDAQEIRDQARRALDRAYESPGSDERQREIERCERAYEQARRQYEKVDDQLAAFVRESAQYTQEQQELLSDIKVLQKQGADWLVNYTNQLKEAKLAIMGQSSGGNRVASGTDAGYVTAPNLSEADANIAKRTIFEMQAFIDTLDLTQGDPAIAQVGGVYRDVKKNVDSTLYEVHHIPPQSVFTDSFERLPTIALLKEDHAQTSSYRGKMNKAYQPSFPDEAAYPKHKQIVRNLAGDGMFAEAVRNEIFEIRQTFGSKYDGAIAAYLSAMIEYIRCNGVPRVKE